jgi:UDP-N-acetylglucosamine--N-acetylmuramyl-(pentapeptide) pyrophosphoryl-undecaprenol N-acetylglucosamine transferase
VAEITALGKASILIPYPHAADGHQHLNAQRLADAGAAELIDERQLSGERLSERIRFFASRPEDLRRMEQNAVRLGQPDAARRIVDECVRLAAARNPGQRAHRTMD